MTRLTCPGSSQVRMRRPVLQGSEVEVVRSGQFYILLLGKHIAISWDQGTHLLVHLSAQYRVRTHCLSLRSSPRSSPRSSLRSSPRSSPRLSLRFLFYEALV